MFDHPIMIQSPCPVSSSLQKGFAIEWPLPPFYLFNNNNNKEFLLDIIFLFSPKILWKNRLHRVRSCIQKININILININIHIQTIHTYFIFKSSNKKFKLILTNDPIERDCMNGLIGLLVGGSSQIKIKEYK